MQSVTQSSPDVFEVLDWTVECESLHHALNDAVTVEHGGEARFYVSGPCKHTTGYRCEPAALSAMLNARGICERCRSSWPRDRFSYWRL